MKEIKAENPVDIENVDGGIVITVPGDNPPMFPMILLSIMTVVLFIVGLESHGFIFISLLLAGFLYFAYKTNKKKQVIKIIGGKLITAKQSFDVASISSIELGNAFSSTSLMSSNSVVVGTGAVGIAAGAVGSALQGATMGLANASLKSGAKKGYYVKIVYGTKKYYVAKRMREIRANALYSALTGN